MKREPKDPEATAARRSAAAKRAAKKRAAAKKADRARRKKEARATPLVVADLVELAVTINELTRQLQRIDNRVGQLHLDVATLTGHCLIEPRSLPELAKEMLDRLSRKELFALGWRDGSDVGSIRMRSDELAKACQSGDNCERKDPFRAD